MVNPYGFAARVLAACLVAFACAAGAARAVASDAVLYRVFLRDGSALVSYGEFARVADRVVMSVPVGEGPTPPLHLVSIAESAVDWERTERYADAARAKQYADTRGENDFTLLSAEVARVLNQVALTEDPRKRLALASEARRALAEWPAQHHNYRASDVAQLSGWLDEVVSELRVAAGESRFDLTFTATTAPAPVEPLLPAPGLRESIELAFAAARATAEPSERVSLLRSIETALAPAGDAPWTGELRTRAAATIATELRTGRAYAELTTRTLEAAEKRARRADVRGIEDLIRKVLADDAKLGRVRPQETAALLASLDARLDATRRLRLARDAWSMRSGVLHEYRRRTRFAFDQLRRSKKWLDDIRRLAGPSPSALNRLSERVATGGRDLSLLKPPPEMETAHGLISTALHMARRAADGRRTALTSGEMKTAWDASAAAAGALMLLEQAQQELDRVTSIPELR